jgi:DUF4097 and DUF4098 domain-containing protein YvlB
MWRNKTSLCIAILTSIALLALAACDNVIIVSDTDTPSEIHPQSLNVGSSPELVVTAFNGEIQVTGGQEGKVFVHTTLWWPDKIDYDVSQDGDVVTIKAEQKERFSTIGGRSPGADIEVTVPVNTSVRLRTSNGMIEVRGTESSGSVETSNGQIVLENIRGDFRAETSNGAIEVNQSRGSVDLYTSNGSITYSGELLPDTRTEMRTSNGGITVNVQGEPSLMLDASTSNSSVKSDLPITASTTGDNHLVGTIGDGEAELVLRTSNASVRIR